MINPDEGKKARGQSELKKSLAGKALTRAQATRALCYDCMGGYTDGRYTCGVKDCPLYPWMPYRDKEKE